MLPSPYDYDNWQDFANALISSLGDGTADLLASGLSGGAGGSFGGGGTSLPAGFDYVYWNGSLANLYLGSPAPDIVTPFQIDTQSLALASVETGQLADLAVSLNKLANLSVSTGKIQDGAILSAKILDAQILTAKIVDAAILTAKIADAQILTAKIGDAQIVTAKIADGSINNAKIDLLAVNTANVANAAITSAKIANLAVGAANIILASIGTAQITDASITTAKIGSAQITTALIANAAIVTALILDANVVTAKIADAAIVTAKIADASILTAKIASAQIVQALIAAAAIGTAQIQDASITNAKIVSLVFDKMTAGTLDAVIDMGTGLIRFTIGGFRLTLGKGFGTTSQFIMWFGPTMAEAAMSEASATFYIKTDGSAYFGGTLSAGLLKNGAVATTHTHTDSSETGAFGSNGNPRIYVAAVNYTLDLLVSASGSWSGTPSYVLYIEKLISGVWTTLTSGTISGSADAGTFFSGEHTFEHIAGSITFTDSSGGLTVDNLRARVDTFAGATFSGSATSITETQRLSILSTEG